MKARIDPDEFDLSQLKETTDSPGFRLLTQRWAETYSAELKKLPTADNWDNVRYIQGVLAGLTIAAQAPEAVRQSIQTRAKKRKAASE